MSYSSMELASIIVPADEEINDDMEWRYEKAPGIGIYIQKLSQDNCTVPMRKCKDYDSGMKYGVYIAYNIDNNVMRSLTKRIIKKGYDPNWLFYVYNSLVKAGFSADDESIFIYEDLNSCSVWTTERAKYELLRKAVSEAIASVALELYRKGDPIDNVDEESYSKISMTQKRTLATASA
ncbi:MAG: hypothetical protein FWG30_10505 [Eubacteriaceae bacterium]|nr:hypothetical protein [Eubacteriaceae bacterium]